MPTPQEIAAFVHGLELADRIQASLVGLKHAAQQWLRTPRGPAIPDERLVRARLREEPLVLPTSEEPLASIVIPVYGKLAVTWACLRSMALTNAGVDYEVIVVDDRSPDDTGDMLASVRGLRMVRNAENLGFIGSSNAGAAAARGQFLVFLNNDTVVTEGWLAALLETFEIHPNAGLVGACLMLPNGRIQEAGGVVFRDGDCSHVGRNRWPGSSAHAYVRPVDYCSGACLAMRRQLFDELGGFDSHFAPAYYEDADLAFRVRRTGRDVLFQPACMVYHYEGTTHGRDVRVGVKRHQLLNRERFFQRWQDVLLASHPAPRHRSSYTADRHRRLRWLVVSDAVDLPAHALPVLNLALSARVLSGQVAWTAMREQDAELLRSLGIEALVPPNPPSLGSFLRGARGHELDLVVLATSSDLEQHLARIRRYAPQARVVFDTSATARPELLGRPTLFQTETALGALSDLVLVDDASAREALHRDLPAARLWQLPARLTPLSRTAGSRVMAVAPQALAAELGSLPGRILDNAR